MERRVKERVINSRGCALLGTSGEIVIAAAVTESDVGRRSDAKAARAESVPRAATPNHLSAALPPSELDQTHNMEVGYWPQRQVET